VGDPFYGELVTAAAPAGMGSESPQLEEKHLWVGVFVNRKEDRVTRVAASGEECLHHRGRGYRVWVWIGEGWASGHGGSTSEITGDENVVSENRCAIGAVEAKGSDDGTDHRRNRGK
jgi:hypothetical protein